jgi:hypothetical protein
MMQIAHVTLTKRIFMRLSDNFPVHESINNMKQPEMADKNHDRQENYISR